MCWVAGYLQSVHLGRPLPARGLQEIEEPADGFQRPGGDVASGNHNHHHNHHHNHNQNSNITY
jgi:hypothetical protein